MPSLSSLAVLLLSLTAAPGSDSRYEYPTQNVVVHDGDTVIADVDLGLGIWLHEQRVRLYGIDAPELNTEAGKKSRDRLLALVEGKEVLLKTIADKKDKYGRWLARLFIESTADCSPEAKLCDVNEWLVINKLAKPYYGSSKKKSEEGQE